MTFIPFNFTSILLVMICIHLFSNINVNLGKLGIVITIMLGGYMFLFSTKYFFYGSILICLGFFIMLIFSKETIKELIIFSISLILYSFVVWRSNITGEQDTSEIIVFWIANLILLLSCMDFSDLKYFKKKEKKE